MFFQLFELVVNQEEYSPWKDEIISIQVMTILNICRIFPLIFDFGLLAFWIAFFISLFIIIFIFLAVVILFLLNKFQIRISKKIISSFSHIFLFYTYILYNPVGEIIAAFLNCNNY